MLQWQRAGVAQLVTIPFWDVGRVFSVSLLITVLLVICQEKFGRHFIVDASTNPWFSQEVAGDAVQSI